MRKLLLTIRKQAPRTTAFVVTSRSIGTKITQTKQRLGMKDVRDKIHRKAQGLQTVGFGFSFFHLTLKILHKTTFSANSSINKKHLRLGRRT